MRCFTFFAALSLCLISFVVIGQEYYRPVSIKPDSVERGTNLFFQRLQALTQSQWNEVERLYRDSFAAALMRADPVFANGRNTLPSALDTLLPRPSFRLINDLLWLNFKLSTDKAAALSLLEVLAKHYPAEEAVQGNLSLGYSIAGKNDSAKAVLLRCLKLRSEGYTSLHVARNIIDYSTEGRLQRIVNLGADSFRLFTENKLYEFPANLDSLRNALATTILHRAGAIKAPDKVTGRLILDFADLTVKDKLYKDALPFYDIATTYDPSLQPSVAERKQTIADAEKSVNNTFTWASIFYLIPLLSLVLILVGWIRSKRLNIRQKNPG
ncbi:MAG: hypothetical protein EOO01_00775 [Chitinophagaceae bacterium]|nr:MAG: hypothetical protein EOO01_00775 [Chitinophagaceae bacterium]